uniref:Uncharacterized protein n=1 Tax=Peronospora matthiolae TaxID=2874970 RepID=A0AAV1TH30_9STRA
MWCTSELNSLSKTTTTGSRSVLRDDSNDLMSAPVEAEAPVDYSDTYLAIAVQVFVVAFRGAAPTTFHVISIGHGGLPAFHAAQIFKRYKKRDDEPPNENSDHAWFSRCFGAFSKRRVG